MEFSTVDDMSCYIIYIINDYCGNCVYFVGNYESFYPLEEALCAVGMFGVL